MLAVGLSGGGTMLDPQWKKERLKLPMVHRHSMYWDRPMKGMLPTVKGKAGTCLSIYPAPLPLSSAIYQTRRITLDLATGYGQP